MADRTPRTSETRDQESRRKPWAPPSYLQAPPPPEGFVHRWVRVSMRGQDDKINVHAKLAEGWEPVRADEYPNYQAPVIDSGMLCRIPAETASERNAYYGGRTREQMQAVDQDLMKDQHPSMPISNSRQSRVSFGGRARDSE